jgi:sec-independent protein translocase protein TatC
MPQGPLVEDPDEYRMSFGEHLDELRTRLVRGVAGFVVAFVICLFFVRDWVFPFLAMPLLDVMFVNDLTPTFYETQTGATFGMYLKLSAIAATIIASPWLLWQVWMFVAAGLYPRERKVVTRHIPLFVLLLVAGVSFAFYIVLPMTLHFFITFTTSVKLPSKYEPIATTMPTMPLSVPVMQGDPPAPIADGMMWFNASQSRMKIAINGHVRILQFAAENLVSPLPSLNDYTDLLLMLLLVFGLSFQTPLAVMLLVRVGIFELDELRQMRRVVYFVIVILAAVITPGDVFTATIALMFPLCGLYELGLLLARRRPAEPESLLDGR